MNSTLDESYFTRHLRRIERNKMLQTNPRTEMASRTEMARPQASLAKKQNLRLLIALSLLMVALAVVLIKDREFWFGSEQALESDANPESIAKVNSAAVPAKTVQAPVARTSTPKNHVAAKPSSRPAVTESAKDANPSPPVVATHRSILPPLDGEVVAGD